MYSRFVIFMMNKIITLLTPILLLIACSDDDTFSISPGSSLTFSTDTLSLDTVFSAVPSPHKQAVVYNHSGDGIRISRVTLENGSRSPFRVNVNGSYVSNSLNDPLEDLELRKGDSLRIFVEATTRNNGDTLPQLVSDNLVFTLDSGKKQKLALTVWSWDATLLRKVTFSKDTTLAEVHGRPILIYDTLTVDSPAVLTIAPATTLYFHSKAGMNIKGTLIVNGEKGREVVFRSNRLDRMVTNLTYDNNPGQWGGIRFASSSYDNRISYADIHAATEPIVCEPQSLPERHKLSIDHSTIHNNVGCGIMSTKCNISMENAQISNASGDCIALYGGTVGINHCTIAQYYPFDANRGMALYFANVIGEEGQTLFPLFLTVDNSIIKGYGDDVVAWSLGEKEEKLNATFRNSIVRTEPGQDYEYMFTDCVIEDPKDTLLNARSYFKLFDTDNFFYDFMPKRLLGSTETVNPAIGKANAEKHCLMTVGEKAAKMTQIMMPDALR